MARAWTGRGQIDTYSLPPLANPPSPVEIFEIRRNGLCRRRRRWVFALFDGSHRRPGLGQLIQLIEQTAKPRDEHDPRHGRKKGRRSLRYQVRS